MPLLEAKAKHVKNFVGFLEDGRTWYFPFNYLLTFSIMQFRQTTWLVLWSFAQASVCSAKVQLLNKSGLKMAILGRICLVLIFGFLKQSEHFVMKN